MDFLIILCANIYHCDFHLWDKFAHEWKFILITGDYHKKISSLKIYISRVRFYAGESEKINFAKFTTRYERYYVRPQLSKYFTRGEPFLYSTFRTFPTAHTDYAFVFYYLAIRGALSFHENCRYNYLISMVGLGKGTLWESLIQRN